MSFDSEFEKVVMIEGGYSDHPSDSGGKTMYGITEAVARAHGYVGPMNQMPLEFAKRVYKTAYWDINRLDEVSAISPTIAREMFDTGVNMGTGRAATFLQRALTRLNRRGRDYPDLAVDGQVGTITTTALRTFLNARGPGIRAAESERVLLELLNCQQGERYLQITETADKNEDFLYGWVLQRVVRR